MSSMVVIDRGVLECVLNGWDNGNDAALLLGTDAIRTALAAAVSVTDAMVEVAEAAWFAADGNNGNTRHGLRCAIEAALAAKETR